MQSEKVLLIVNEPNQNVYLSGRNVATLAINTAHAVQVRGSGGRAVQAAGQGRGDTCVQPALRVSSARIAVSPAVLRRGLLSARVSRPLCTSDAAALPARPPRCTMC